MEASDIKELRVILDNIDVLNDEWFDTFPTDEGQTCIHDSLEYEITKANKILAKHPRQCDMGTAAEQDNRMDVYCQTRKCESCPLWDNVNNGVRCEFTWAQMPYEAEEGGER